MVGDRTVQSCASSTHVPSAYQTGQHATAHDSQSLGSYPLFIAARFEIRKKQAAQSAERLE